MGSSMRTGARFCSASWLSWTSVWSSAFSRPWSWPVVLCADEPSVGATSARIGARSSPLAFQWSTAAAVSSSETWPTASSMLRKPSAARCSRTSSAMYSKKVSTNSGLPEKRARSSGFWVAMPTGQVSRWQTRIMMQPLTTSGAVAKPNSGAEQRGDDDVAAGLELPVDLDDDAVAQAVEHQGLLGLGQPELPRRAGVLQGRQWRGAGAAVVARDEHHVGVRLGHPRRDRADSDLGDELDVHPGRGVGVLEVVDELRQVLDRVDVVVRRRRDEPDTGGGVPRPGHPRVDLVSGQLATLAGLGALGHLDLDVVGLGQVEARDAEPSRGDLLD